MRLILSLNFYSIFIRLTKFYLFLISKSEPNLQFIRALKLVGLFLIYFNSKIGLILQVMKVGSLVD